MARPRSAKVDEVLDRLRCRLENGLYRPGDRFMSNRAIARQFQISYQTAHRIATVLQDENLLERRPASGTYVAGRSARRSEALLVFHERARRTGSFGARLLKELIARLGDDGVPRRVRYAAPDIGPSQLSPEVFPVLWDVPAWTRACVRAHHPALLLNQRPPAGMASLFIDSISVDDFSGGACAAELLCRRAGSDGPFAIVAGPIDDPRSNARVQGFLSIARARRFDAGSWFRDQAMPAARAAVASRPIGIFCCNDRLAQAVLDVLASRPGTVPRPAIVGFDDAPIAETLGLTTIAMPWSELADAAASRIRQRIARTPSHPVAANRQVFMPRPVIRGT